MATWPGAWRKPDLSRTRGLRVGWCLQSDRIDDGAAPVALETISPSGLKLVKLWYLFTPAMQWIYWPRQGVALGASEASGASVRCEASRFEGLESGREFPTISLGRVGYAPPVAAMLSAGILTSIRRNPMYPTHEGYNDTLHGYYLEDLRIGMSASHAKTVTETDVVMFAGFDRR